MITDLKATIAIGLAGICQSGSTPNNSKEQRLHNFVRHRLAWIACQLTSWMKIFQVPDQSVNRARHEGTIDGTAPGPSQTIGVVSSPHSPYNEIRIDGHSQDSVEHADTLVNSVRRKPLQPDHLVDHKLDFSRSVLGPNVRNEILNRAATFHALSASVASGEIIAHDLDHLVTVLEEAGLDSEGEWWVQDAVATTSSKAAVLDVISRLTNKKQRGD